jgi:putative acetyltransferase
MGTFVVGIDDPESADVRALLDKHLSFARDHSPPEDVHALDIPGLLAENVSFFSIREAGALVAVGALKQLDEFHAEVKSMHTAEGVRGRGVGRAMVDHLIAVARARGCRRISLETGSMAAFAPARALYASAGFALCQPFADYRLSPNSVCMTLELDQSHRSDAGSTQLASS